MHTAYTPPATFYRYVPPTPAELDQRIEYDLDDQDEAWLVLVNAERERAADASGSGRGPPGLLGGLFARLTGQDPAGGATSSSSEEDEPPAKRM